MVIDEKGRLFGKVSIIDIVVILVIIAACSLVWYKFGRYESLNKPVLATEKTAVKKPTPVVKKDDIIIEFYEEEAPDYAARSIKPGDIVIDPAKRNEFGNVTEIAIDKSVSWAQTAAGKFVASSKPGYASIHIKVSGKGVYGEKGIKVGKATYFIGKTLEIRVANTAFYVRIFDIRKAAEIPGNPN